MAFNRIQYICAVSAAAAALCYLLAQPGGTKPMGNRIPLGTELAGERPYTPSEECTNDALTSLLIGSCTPPFDDLSVGEQDDLVGRFGAILQAYKYADYEAFLYLRQPDIEAADKANTERLQGLARLLSAEFGVKREAIPCLWSEALGLFFNLLYSKIGITELLTDKTRVRFFEQGAGEGGLNAFTLNSHEIMHFKSRNSVTSSSDASSLVLPHRFRLDDLLARHPEGLKCFDLNFHVVMQQGNATCPVEILVRFAWNPEQAEWFIYSAISGYPDNWGPSLPQFPILM